MKIFTFLISFFFCLNLNAQKGKLFLSSWNNNGNEDLNIPFNKYKYFEKGKFYYFLSNDNDNIYIDMKVMEPAVQNRILKQGLTVWVNMDRKRSKKMGIRFPIGSQNSGDRNKSDLPRYNSNSDSNRNLVIPLSLANTIELVGFTRGEERRFSADNSDNFRGSMQYDNEGNLHYKMIMPIAKLPVRNSKDGDGPMPFSFGIEYGQATTQPVYPPVLLWVKNIKLATDK